MSDPLFLQYSWGTDYDLGDGCFVTVLRVNILEFDSRSIFTLSLLSFSLCYTPPKFSKACVAW